MTNTFSPNILNNARFGFNRAAFTQGETGTLPYSVAVTGAFTKLDDATGSVRYDNSFSFVDDATFVHGRSTIKAGVTVRRIQENKSSPSVPDEIYTYASTTNFLNNLMDSDSYAGVVPLTGQRMTESFGYILDQFQFSRQLTFNVGMRYEYFGVDHEVLGRGIIVDPIACANVICPAGTGWYQPNLTDVSPRLSVAYAPEQFHGKSVIRAGYGIYYGDGQFGNLGTPVGNLSNKYSLTQQQAPGLSFPVTPYLGAAGHQLRTLRIATESEGHRGRRMDHVDPDRGRTPDGRADRLLRYACVACLLRCDPQRHQSCDRQASLHRLLNDRLPGHRERRQQRSLPGGSAPRLLDRPAHLRELRVLALAR